MKFGSFSLSATKFGSIKIVRQTMDIVDGMMQMKLANSQAREAIEKDSNRTFSPKGTDDDKSSRVPSFFNQKQADSSINSVCNDEEG